MGTVSRCMLTWAACLWFLAPGAEADDWPMLAHDAQRSGASPDELRPPFERKWYRLFPSEGIQSGVQPVVARGRLYLGTLRGFLYALDAESGRVLWRFQAGGSILHSAATDGDRVYFGAADGKVYALNAATGDLLWTFQTGAALWNAPAWTEDFLYIGSRDGHLYALDRLRGSLRWRARTGGPVLQSPAVDVERRRVYVGSEDMHVYAFDAAQGALHWTSPRLPGASLRGYYPVVAPDGSVLVTTQPCVALDDLMGPLLHVALARDIFGEDHFYFWKYSNRERDLLKERLFRRLAQPNTYTAQLNFLQKRLAQQPAFQTFFVLDPDSGKPRFVAPVVYAESMNGPGSPPVVTPDGKVVVKYQVLLKSRFGHYSPFLHVGYLDTRTGWMEPVFDPERTYGWHDSLLLVHDEQCQLTVAGRVLINTHQDNVNGFDLSTRVGYTEPFCHNIHEPEPGEALGIWGLLLQNQELPPGKEWLIRGTAVYGGGSVLDTSVVVADDSFYYVPTHELNSGVGLIAYRSRPKGDAWRRRPAPKVSLTPELRAQLEQLPWDWDVLETPRLRPFLLRDLEPPPEGTAACPARDVAGARLEAVSDDELERLLLSAPVRPASPGDPELVDRLQQALEELLSTLWRPLIFPPGKHPREAYRLFVEPTETLFTLARAYPYVSPDLRARVRAWVEAMRKPGAPLAPATGQRVYSNQGTPREAYQVDLTLVSLVDDVVREPLGRLYPLWLWIWVSEDWAFLKEHWPQWRPLAFQEPPRTAYDWDNATLAGLVAYCRMASYLGDQEAVNQGRRWLRLRARQRVARELAHPRGGLLTELPVGRTTFGRWRFLTPEVGRLVAAYARPVHASLMETYVDYHRPAWWLAWNVELQWRNEAPFSLPTTAMEIFAAKAWILGSPRSELLRYLDLPWCKADEYFIQKLVLCLEALKDH
jgi:hypothetical protein